MAQDDYIRTALRVPPDLHKQLHEAAKAADRTFNAEILSRLQQSFEPSISAQAMNLAPTIVRLERDVARLEVDKTADVLNLRMFASTLRALLDGRPEQEVVKSMYEGSTVKEWIAVCDAVLEHKQIEESDFEASYERLRIAESGLRRLMPTAADPLWEIVGAPKRAAPAATPPAESTAQPAGRSARGEISGGDLPAMAGWTRDQGDMPGLPDDPADLLRLADQRESEAKRLRDVHRSYTARGAAMDALAEIDAEKAAKKPRKR